VGHQYILELFLAGGFVPAIVEGILYSYLLISKREQFLLTGGEEKCLEVKKELDPVCGMAVDSKYAA